MAPVAKTTARAGKRKPTSTIGIALAGGGPLGGIYELGALAALADCLTGVDLNELDVYVGVSSGAFVAAGLANGMTPAYMSQMFIESDRAAEPFDPALLLRPAYKELMARLTSIPGLSLNAVWRLLTRRDATAAASLLRIARALPTGLFDGAEIDRALTEIFKRHGRSNDFRTLGGRLLIVATDLDSSGVVAFGADGVNHIPISTAVQASAALPGLFPPVEIDGRYYADGALQKTLHASVALDHGADLVLCINPLVAFDSSSHPSGMRVVDGGLPAVLSQTFRTMLRSRLQKGMDLYASEYPGRDLILFEPERYDTELFFANIFSYSNRRRLAEHAYQGTRATLLRRRDELEPKLAKHGIRFNEAALSDPEAHLVQPAVEGRRRRPESRVVVGRLNGSLDRLERLISVNA